MPLVRSMWSGAWRSGWPPRRRATASSATPLGNWQWASPPGRTPAASSGSPRFLTASASPMSYRRTSAPTCGASCCATPGCNQAALVFQCDYGPLQVPGKPRDTMIGAMREVAAVANGRGRPAL